MKPDRLLAIGGSAGSLQVILAILASVRSDFPMPVLSSFTACRFRILPGRPVFFPHKSADQGGGGKGSGTTGTVYLCPADYHVLLEQDQTFSLDYSERVNFSRPSIDVSFRSAADVYGAGLLAVLLSGGNADGVEGLEYVKERGGITVVQDPATAEVPYMPQQAVIRMQPDHVLATQDLLLFIRQWAYT